MMSLVLGVEGPHIVGTARDQRGRRVLRKLHQRQFSGWSRSSAGRLNAGALALGLLQQVGGVDESGIKGGSFLRISTASNWLSAGRQRVHGLPWCRRKPGSHFLEPGLAGVVATWV